VWKRSGHQVRKPRPPSRIGRKRRALGWTLLIFGVLVAAVWVWSGWWRLSMTRERSVLWIENGAAGVAVRNYSFVLEPGLHIDRTTRRGGAAPTWQWWQSATAGSEVVRFVGVGVAWYERWADLTLGLDQVGLVLWPIPLLLWPPAALLLRSGILARRRAMTCACAKCGYSLAGLARDANCPECGREASRYPGIEASRRGEQIADAPSSSS
jgi:hypothetical protein